MLYRHNLDITQRQTKRASVPKLQFPWPSCGDWRMSRSPEHSVPVCLYMRPRASPSTFQCSRLSEWTSRFLQRAGGKHCLARRTLHKGCCLPRPATPTFCLAAQDAPGACSSRPVVLMAQFCKAPCSASEGKRPPSTLKILLLETLNPARIGATNSYEQCAGKKSPCWSCVRLCQVWSSPPFLKSIRCLYQEKS